jgi:hypothetical protein
MLCRRPELTDTGRNGDGPVWVSRVRQQERPGTAASTIHFVRPKERRRSRWDPGAACAQYASRAPLGRRPCRPVRPSQRSLGSRYRGSRLSPPGPGARVPAVALPAEGRRSACLAAGSTRRPRKRARARSGRRNTSPGSCPPAPSRHTPFLRGSAMRLHLPTARRRTHLKPARRAGGWTTVGDRSLLPAARPAEFGRRRSLAVVGRQHRHR